MTAAEDPASQVSGAPAGAGQPRDDLEHWLSDLRTEEATAPSWAAGDTGEEPAEPDRPQAGAAEPKGGGRHRAAE